MYENIIKKILKSKDVYILTSAAVLSLILVLVSSCSTSKVPKKATNTGTPSLDTIIPKGFSLVPIDIANYETLDSLLGSFGVVDLYTQPLSEDGRSKRIAYRVKIMRAPRNPSHFAVLVPFEKVDKILRYTGPFMASIQNPKSGGTVFEKEIIQKPSRVTYNIGD